MPPLPQRTNSMPIICDAAELLGVMPGTAAVHKTVRVPREQRLEQMPIASKPHMVPQHAEQFQ